MDLSGFAEDIRALPLLSPLDRSQFSVAEQEKLAPFFEMHDAVSALQEILPALMAAIEQGAAETAAAPEIPPATAAIRMLAKQVLPQESPDEVRTIGDSPEPDATRTELGQTAGTQDEDTWVLGESEYGVEVEDVTDIKFDTSAHTLTFRTRTKKYDPNGRLLEVTAEGDAVTVTTSKPCPTE